MLGLGAALLLAACAEDDPILTGKREGLREVLKTDAVEPARSEVVGANSVNVTAPVRLAAPVANSEWTQRIGTPATRVAHPAFSAAPQLAWSASIGKGDSARSRITADPVVAGGRVFVMDASAQVTALSTNGEVLWTANLVPPTDSAGDGSGGGLPLATASCSPRLASGF